MVTRLGLYGGPRSPYGSFAGKTEQIIQEVTAQPGAGSGRKKKYPRRVVIDGVVYWVNSAEEERALLLRHRDAVERQALELAVSGASKEQVAKARVKVVRASRRVDAVDDREAEWLAYLREEDEEFLTVYQAVYH